MRSVTPTASVAGRKSPFRVPMPPRSATAPLPYSPPSPDFPLPQDCAFPVFPTTKSRSATPTTPSSKKSFDSARPAVQADSSSIVAPKSTRIDAGGFLEKMNNAQEPFGAAEIGADDAVLFHTRTATMGGSREYSRAPSVASNRSQMQRPLTSGSDHVEKKNISNIAPGPRSALMRAKSDGSPLSYESTAPSTFLSNANDNTPSLPPTNQNNERVDPFRPVERSQTFPPHGPSRGTETQPVVAQSRRPSESSSINHPRRPSVSAANRPLHEIGSTTSFKAFRASASRSSSPVRSDADPHVRSASRTGERTDRRLNNAPPVPAPTRADDFNIGNPYHTPTESTSSNESSSSDRKSGSSRSSPPLSETSYPSRTKSSDKSDAGGGSNDMQKATNDGSFQQEPPRQRRGTAKSFSRPTYAVPVDPTPVKTETPESPMDPAFQDARFVPSLPAKQYPRPQPLRTASSDSYQPTKQYPPPQPSPKESPDSYQPMKQYPPSSPRRISPESYQPMKQYPPSRPRQNEGHERAQSPSNSHLPQQLRQIPVFAPPINNPPGRAGPSKMSQVPITAPSTPIPGGKADLSKSSQPHTTAPLTQNPPAKADQFKPSQIQGQSQPLSFPPLDTPTVPAPPLQRPDIADPVRRPMTANKGKCRGCAEIIQGKSVSSADGRLTGRYHKRCFVCKTCKEPFKTADFYVIENNPYCQRHYHELNGSVCKSCDRGIEGQYLETELKQKFHPHCFTCQVRMSSRSWLLCTDLEQDCHKILRDDYFELSGKVLCEQHAFRAAQEPSLLGPGRRHPERRTTRLMMM